MSWQEHLTTLVRVLINDLTEPYEFSDDRMLQVITVSAKYVQFDVNLDNKYTVDIITPNITPDPTVINDEIFLSLVGLKAACLFDQSAYRTKAAMEGIKTVLGPASLSINGAADAWESIIKHGACSVYDELTSHWDVANATAVRAILSPFAGNTFNPRAILRGNFRLDNNDIYS